MLSPTRAYIEKTLAASGLRLRGGFIPDASDALPPLPDGRVPAVVWMAGMVGSECWSVFSTSPIFSDGLANPLDRWSASIGDALAKQWHGLALYPFDGPPYFPFQRWADRCEPTQASPMMLRIHPEYGLWHAYRFALAVPFLQAGDLEPPAPLQPASADLCLRCDGQPCLNACPVGAYSRSGFLLDSCAGHLHHTLGAECMDSGCKARMACPVATTFRYTKDHAQFHMRAFAASHS
jgi:ferredoxin-like protein FixX